MRVASVEEMRAIDERAQTERGLSAEILMESAGSLSAREIELSYFSELKRGEVIVVCGPGNNGADGAVVARHLKSQGHRVRLTYSSSPTTELAMSQLERAKDVGVAVEPWSSRLLDRATLIVDAIFGIGLNKDVSGEAESLINAINSSKAPVVALDTPSGLDCDRGVARGVSVRASMTLTFGLMKRGFFVQEGAKYAGRVRRLAIGFPPDLVKEVAASNFVFDSALAKKYLPRRSSTSNKTTHGKALIFAGSRKYAGAALLAANAAARVGAGYVWVAPSEGANEILKSNPEFLVSSPVDPRIWEPRAFTACAIGPGFGVGEQTLQLVQRLIDENVERVVLDADALTVIAKEKGMKLPSSWIITPHAGELSRITGVSAQEIERNRFDSAQEASRKLGCIVLLKGFRTVISNGQKNWCILSGNSALAKAGSGDVLTGMLVGFLAQAQTSPVTIAALASFLHGKLADLWVSEGKDEASLIPSDLLRTLPELLRRVRQGVET